MHLIKISLLTFIFFTSFVSKGEEVITLGVTKKTLESSLGKFSHALYKELFKKIGYKLIVETYPPIRLAKRTRNGKIDGELIRMSSYSVENPHLIKVSEPHFHFSIAAYSALDKKKVTSFSDFSSNSVSYRRELKVVENEIRSIVSKENLYPTTDIFRTFKLVENKRIDFYLGVEKFTDEFLAKEGSLFKSKVKKKKVLKSDTAHVFLLKKHSHLTKLLAKELRIMKKSGEIKNFK